MNHEMSPEDSPPRELVARRVFDAPTELVFEAWTDPKRLTRWWGPKGFTTTFQEFDPRPGGRWRFVMHAPNGTEFANENVFVEIIKPERIVFDHLSGPVFRVIATFEAQSAKTHLTFRMIFETAAERDKVKSFAVEANEQNLDRLGAELARMKGTS